MGGGCLVRIGRALRLVRRFGSSPGAGSAVGPVRARRRDGIAGFGAGGCTVEARRGSWDGWEVAGAETDSDRIALARPVPLRRGSRGDQLAKVFAHVALWFTGAMLSSSNENQPLHF